MVADVFEQNSGLDRISQVSDSVNNAYSAYKPPKAGANYDAPHGVAAKIIADFRAQVRGPDDRYRVSI